MSDTAARAAWAKVFRKRTPEAAEQMPSTTQPQRLVPRAVARQDKAAMWRRSLAAARASE